MFHNQVSYLPKNICDMYPGKLHHAGLHQPELELAFIGGPVPVSTFVRQGPADSNLWMVMSIYSQQPSPPHALR